MNRFYQGGSLCPVPMITPIDQDELIDEKAIRSQVDYVIDGGVSGILLWKQR